MKQFVSTVSHRSIEQTVSDSTKEDGDDSVGDIDDRDGGKEGVPEPEHKVDLLVDNILRQNTQTVVGLKYDPVSHNSRLSLPNIRA